MMKEIECLNKAIGYIAPVLSLMQKFEDDPSQFTYGSDNYKKFLYTLKSLTRSIYYATLTNREHTHDPDKRVYLELIRDEIKDLLDRHEDRVYESPGIYYYGQLDLALNYLDEYLSSPPTTKTPELGQRPEIVSDDELRKLKALDLRAYINKVFEKATLEALSEPDHVSIAPDPIIQGMRMKENVSEDRETYRTKDELILDAVKSIIKKNRLYSRNPEKYQQELSETEPAILERAVDFILEVEKDRRVS